MKHIFLETQQRIKDTIPEIKWIDQDLGQLEFYTDRPAVLFPCCLIDFDDITFSNMGNHAQLCTAMVNLRVAFSVLHHSNQVTPQPYREKALEIFDVLKKIHQYLHGWSGEQFGEMTRIRQTAEAREDTLRVYNLQFQVQYEEYFEPSNNRVIRPVPVLVEGNVFSDEFDDTFS